MPNENSYVPPGLLGRGSTRDAASCRIQWLINLALKDRHDARGKALEYTPELASKICFVKDDEGEMVPCKQLPCRHPRLCPTAGKIIGYDELSLLFVASGPHGKHAYIA